ncbi:MAG TPA: alpha/beta hydrolase-fold protein [Flavisolibacter sp.]|nr:alpha/beta hydrolase-fold protein [Flavisolibacter sp.]
MRIAIKLTFLLLPLLVFSGAAAQFKVSFVVTGLPAYHGKDEPLFITGSFCNWNPGDGRMRFGFIGGKPGITIELSKGMFEYKITRGSWDKAEAAAGGLPIANRQLQLESDTTIEIAIEHWSDHFPKRPKQTTASPNVHVIDTAFFIPQLNRHRRVWIYLPAQYAGSGERYPVVYMQDGQNVFDEASSAYGEWGVDEALDSLPAGRRQAIIVAIDNGGSKRINEYAPYDMERFGKGEGDMYVDFLAKTLKPYIDRNYRTKKGRDHSFVAGSSMGALISFYAVLKYPGVFGGAGIFSPAFWVNPRFRNLDPKKLRKLKSRLYFYAGREEGEQMVPDMLAVFDQLHRHSKARMETVIRAEGKHNEATWRGEWVNFFDWLMNP